MITKSEPSDDEIHRIAEMLNIKWSEITDGQRETCVKVHRNAVSRAISAGYFPALTHEITLMVRR